MASCNWIAHSTTSTAELDQDPIAHKFDNSTTMLNNRRLQNFRAAGLERNEGAGLIPLHEAAVPDDISGQDCSEPALDAFFGHCALGSRCDKLQLRDRPESIATDFRSGSDPDLGEWRAGVLFHLESGLDLARPVGLMSARSRHA
jgi:hypothetical protein